MGISWVDYVIVVIYTILSVAVGFYYSRQAGSSTDEFFVAGRKLPWWIAGTSMAATTFAVDTPLAVTGLVVREGIYGNWIWINGVFFLGLTTFFFAAFWRRANIITDVELAEIRYSGKPAKILRVFRAVYFGLFMNCFTLGWVVLAMQKVLVVSFELDNVDLGGYSMKSILVSGCLLVAGIYSTLSGFIGVVKTDVIQFAVAMFSAYALAIFAVVRLGGIGSIQSSLITIYGEEKYDRTLSVFPDINDSTAMWTFITYMLFWVCNKNSDGSGYYAQRLFSVKTEQGAVYSMFLFNFLNFVVRPWPWIIVALASMVAYPNLEDPERGYPMIMMDYMPVGFLGLMLTGFLAAFMSTVDTHFNWGASYLVNDVYKRFLRPNESEKHYVMISRVVIMAIMVLTGIISTFLQSVSGAWKILIAVEGSIGSVYIMRWLWWRVNAWSEISAMLSSAFISLVLFLIPATRDSYPLRMGILIPTSVAIWITVTLVTPPVDSQVLVAFYNRIKPRGLWNPVIEEAKKQREAPGKEGLLQTDSGSDQNTVELDTISEDATSEAVQPRNDASIPLLPAVINWLLGCIFIFCATFGIGEFILGFYAAGSILLLGAITAGLMVALRIENAVVKL